MADGALDTVTGPRLGAELRLLLREPQPDALAALERHGIGAAVLGPGFARPAEHVVQRSDRALSRATRAPTSRRWPPALSGDRRTIAATLDRARASRPPSATSSSPRRRSAGYLTTRSTRRRPAERRRALAPAAHAARRDRRGRRGLRRRGSHGGCAPLARRRPPPQACDHRRRLRRGRAGRAAGRRCARRRDRGDARRPRARRARRSSPPAWRRPAPSIHVDGDRHASRAARALPLGGRARRGRPAGRSRAVHDAPRRRLQRRVRLAQPGAPDGRRRRQRGRESRPRGGRHRLPARALPLRPPGARRDRPACHRAARAGAPACGGGRPGDSAHRPSRTRVHRRLHTRAARRRRRGRGAARRLARRRRRHREATAWPRCATAAGPAP